MDKNNQMESYPDQDKYRSNSNEGSRGAEKQKRRRNEKRREEFNVKQDQKDENFRDNFRGTRVFVQGLPSSCSWQDLKDHMKIAGEVVFASVSIDPDSGKSKGCGVVQYESTAGAQNAMKTMRDHPLDGYDLFVREDFQESRGENRQLGERRVRGPTPPSIWTCADETNLALLSEEDSTTVKNLIKAREQARKRKNYETSDNIREDLKSRYAVHLDDRKKMWWVSPDNKVPQTILKMQGEGRWGKQAAWRQIPTTPENDACVNPDLVSGLLQQRDIARREKDFRTADRLLEDARSAPDNNLFLRIHDESRTWRIWTEERPQMAVSHGQRENYGQRESYGQRENDRQPAMSPEEQCIAIVTKHDPSKITDVKNLLQKFPGREYNILKKLKQNYNL